MSVGGPTSVVRAPTSASASISERATRECRTSPTIATCRPVEPAERLAHRVEVEQRLGRVLVLAVAGVDDVRARRLGDELRRADVRVPDHDHVRVVLGERQRRVLQRLALVDGRAGRAHGHRVGREPLGGEVEARERARRGFVEEVDDEPAAERRQLLDFAVERARDGGGGAEQPLDVVAVEVGDAEQVAPRRRRWRLARQLRCGAEMDGLSHRSSSEQHDAVAVVRLVELDADTLGERGRDVLADVVRPDRQLAVATVDEDGELHPRGAPVLEQGVDRGADRAAGEEDVVDEHDRLALEREVELGAADDRLRVERRPAAADEHVVAVERDVDGADVDLHARALGDERPQPVGKRHAAGVDADERQRVEVGVALDQLVRDSGERPLDRRGVEQGLGRIAAGVLRRHRCSFPASLCRFKGVSGECRRWPDGSPGGRAGDDDSRSRRLTTRCGSSRSARAVPSAISSALKQVEGRDVAAVDARQRLLAAELALGRQPAHLDAREPGRGQLTLHLARASGISRASTLLIEGKNGCSQ